MTDASFVSSPLLASYASRWQTSRGRRIPEDRSALRTSFQRDRDRIIHSAAFRRLALKTQVFVPDEGDHFRTRLTHTIEVAQIARTIARALRLDEDLSEALALAHDLGHPPFGHTGEEALDDVLAPFGGFDHNAQTLRILVMLERRYPAFPGLNLTWDTLDGLAKRGSAACGTAGRTLWFRQDLSCFAAADAWTESLGRFDSPGAEAQAADVADDIAYNAHDVEDGLEAGLFAPEDLDAVDVVRELRLSLMEEHPRIEDDLVARGLARQLVGVFVEDAVVESRRLLASAAPSSAEDVRRLETPVVALSPAMLAQSKALKAFLFNRMYRHPRLTGIRSRAKTILRELAERLLAAPECLPPEWHRKARDDRPDAAADARRVADYIAGMTDRFAIAEHRRLFDATPELR